MNTKPKNIEIIGVGKRFRLRTGPRVFLNLLFSGSSNGGRRNENILDALKEIDLSVSGGEVVGLIGKNGSGKSTLLKVLAGLHAEDAGTVRLTGKALYLSGFYYASNPYMTVRENAYLMGTIFGLRRREIRSKMKEMLDFAGLDRFIDVETFKLSSGMITRLNTSVTFHCMEHARPNILLLDEVLSVGGDIEFQSKSMEKISRLVRGGAAVLAATHDLEFAEKSCDRVVWLENGRIRMQGRPAEVVSAYKNAYA